VGDRLRRSVRRHVRVRDLGRAGAASLDRARSARQEAPVLRPCRRHSALCLRAEGRPSPIPTSLERSIRTPCGCISATATCRHRPRSTRASESCRRRTSCSSSTAR
jgi:hypothetical protein